MKRKQIRPTVVTVAVDSEFVTITGMQDKPVIFPRVAMDRLIERYEAAKRALDTFNAKFPKP